MIKWGGYRGLGLRSKTPSHGLRLRLRLWGCYKGINARWWTVVFSIIKSAKKLTTVFVWQVSAVADEPARRAASRHTCCKQRVTPRSRQITTPAPRHWIFYRPDSDTS